MLFSSNARVSIRAKIRLTSNWLVVMHTYLYNFRLSLSHCQRAAKHVIIQAASDKHLLRRRTNRVADNSKQLLNISINRIKSC